MTQPLNVLFLCTGNSARSIIAEAIVNREGRGRFRGYSAGSHPNGEVNPNTLRLLEGLHYDTGGFRSKSWDEFAGPDAPKLDFVFTVCDDAAAEICPIWPGQPMTAQWIVPDPATLDEDSAEGGLKLAQIYRDLDNRIRLLVNLPMEALDRLALQMEMEAIGGAQSTELKRS